MKKKILMGIMAGMMLVLSACAKEIVNPNRYANLPPETAVTERKLGIDFVEMHNYVIDDISERYTPYFFVKKNAFDISGSNEDPKKIIITCDCQSGTVRQDIDLFLSDVLNLIGTNAAEQDYKYKAPSLDKERVYVDFGTVFNDYDLVLKVTVEGKDYLYNETIKAGNKIPVDPRYYRED